MLFRSLRQSRNLILVHSASEEMRSFPDIVLRQRRTPTDPKAVVIADPCVSPAPVQEMNHTYNLQESYQMKQSCCAAEIERGSVAANTSHRTREKT